MKALLTALARAIVTAAALAAACLPAVADDMQKGFVHLADIDDSIVQDIRYAGRDNFTGAPVPGYGADECVLAEPVARALSRVQAGFRRKGKTLIVFDCYRPARAVRSFMAWTKRAGATRDKRYHPHVARGQLVAQGYIAARSGHSSGGSVDVSFGVRDASGRVTSARMGGGFDLFDRRSHTANGEAGKEALANRRELVESMAREGFVNYEREWWHFRYRDEPFAGRAFDFPITAR